MLQKILIFLIVMVCAACVSVLPTADKKLKNKEYVEAISLYEQYLTDNPNETETRGKLGFAYLKTGKLDDAIREFKRVLAEEPGHPHAILYLGQSFFNKREYDNARNTWALKRNDKKEKIEAEIEHQRGMMLIEESQNAAKEALANENKVDAVKAKPNTIAVCYYNDKSVDKSLKPFQKGLTSMVTTYLAGIKSIKVLERERMQALLAEMKLGMTGIVDTATAPRVGKLLGVETLVVGGLAKGSIEATTTLASSTKKAVTGSSVVKVEEEKFFELASIITRDIVNLLGVELTEQEKKSIEKPFTKNYKAFVYYGQALDAVDAGNWEKAKDLFAKAIKHDDSFKMAKHGFTMAAGGGSGEGYTTIAPLMIMNNLMQQGGPMGMGGGMHR